MGRLLGYRDSMRDSVRVRPWVCELLLAQLLLARPHLPDGSVGLGASVTKSDLAFSDHLAFFCNGLFVLFDHRLRAV